MNKLARLLADLGAAPLKLSADHLLIFTEAGSLTQEPRHENQDFAIRYTAMVLVSNWSKDPLVLFYFVARWMARNERNHGPDAIQWEADLLDRQTYDVTFSLDLSEVVVVEQQAEGVQLTPVTDPDPNPITLPSGEWQVFVNDSLFMVWDKLE